MPTIAATSSDSDNLMTLNIRSVPMLPEPMMATFVRSDMSSYVVAAGENVALTLPKPVNVAS